MEQDIYVDILVFLNTVINFFCFCYRRPGGTGKKNRENSGGGIFGGIYALILLLPQLNGPVPDS